ncbi:hypothetical protein HPB52_013392 [Rhipicephalus sanguineus]|uniref:Uncharacterized protein n=1 Tax=Rhipicephalus sanguineus TaxID=34632 RepID=A0A9D4Q034_RHISA|nr:hypothetical protein HPB52_013392 [Rhipicephalus sanguineus]
MKRSSATRTASVHCRETWHEGDRQATVAQSEMIDQRKRRSARWNAPVPDNGGSLFRQVLKGPDERAGEERCGKEAGGVGGCSTRADAWLLSASRTTTVRVARGDESRNGPKPLRASESIGGKTPQKGLLTRAAGTRCDRHRYNSTWSIVMVFISNLVLMFNLFVMVVTRYLRYDIRNSIGQLLREAADEDTMSPLPSSFY